MSESMELKVCDECRSAVIRELDAKYKDICARKIEAVITEMEKRIVDTEALLSLNTESIRNGMAKNKMLQRVADAAAYCFRNGHIDDAAILFSGLDQALHDLEGRNGTGPHR